MINQLDSIHCKLSGINIIEAGAGTGKTYNIQNLFARMVMEKAIPVSEILVVTFTEAATKELKDRIRNILHELDIHLTSGDSAPTDDERITALIKHLFELNPNGLDQYRHLIKTAIRDFDEASIFTIHGFCRRMLSDNAFESGILFNIELEQNPSGIIQEIIEEFWRSRFYGPRASRIELCATEYNGLDIGSLFSFVSSLQNRHGIKCLSGEEDISTDLQNRFKKVKELWNRDAVFSQLIGATLSGARANHNSDVIKAICDAADNMTVDNLDNNTLKHLYWFSQERIEKSSNTKSNLSVLTHPFFQAVNDLFASLKRFAIQLKLDCRKYFEQRYSARKQSQNFQTFNDLLINLDRRISIDGDDALLNAIQAKYQAAMIDEFQDTDPVQYRIFKRIFIDSNRPIFMVGDPKQAIYGFRGGDIYTYIGAKQEAARKYGNEYTLLKNWRSTPGMVEAVNNLFGSLEKPFLNKKIEFNPAESSDKGFSHLEQLAVRSKPDSAPMKVIMAEGNPNSSNLTKFCCETTAMKIFELLNDRSITIPDGSGKVRNLLPKDFAILVSKHQQATDLLPYFLELRIPCVLQNTGSIFDSSESEELELLLAAVADCKNSRLLRGALTTNMIGMNATDLTELSLEGDTNNTGELEKWQEFFKTLNRMWINNSFIEMFNHFMTEKDVRSLLLSHPGGERALTNLLHLSEILHQHEIDKQPGVNGLVNWLSKQRNPATRDDSDEYEIRLESDKSAVTIMTVHKSKGLEFPIVFCPFLWDRTAVPFRNNGGAAFYHDSDDNMVMNMVPEAEDWQKTYEENMQELMRLAYVAVTRSRYRCYLTGAAIKSKPTSAFYYLFANDICMMALNGEKVKEIKVPIPETLLDTVPEYSSAIPYSFTEELPLLELKHFTGSINQNWRITSFSGLAPHASHAASSSTAPFQDYDESDNNSTLLPVPAAGRDGELTIFNFPAGAKTGTCWHEIFEELNFTSDKTTINSTATDILNKYGLATGPEQLAARKYTVVSNMVSDVLNTPLDGFKLAEIEEKDRLAELEFNFKLNERVDTTQIAAKLADFAKEKFGLNDFGDWDTVISGGFMIGFIDLLFRHNHKYYILDWKSNRLNGQPDGFDAPVLRDEMARNFYFLQYLFYTVALHRYLKSRLGANYDFDSCFGGIYYMFLRGVNPAVPGRGVFYDRPDFALITELDKLLGANYDH